MVGRTSISAEFSTLIKYGIVGLFNTALGLGVMVGLQYLGVHYALYTSAGYIVAFCSSYILNALFTFRTGPPSTVQFIAFVVANGVLLLAVQGLQYLLIDVLGVRELYGVIVGAFAYTGTGFLINKLAVYRPAAGERTAN
jgi:putative flippase GtrA